MHYAIKFVMMESLLKKNYSLGQKWLLVEWRILSSKLIKLNWLYEVEMKMKGAKGTLRTREQIKT